MVLVNSISLDFRNRALKDLDVDMIKIITHKSNYEKS